MKGEKGDDPSCFGWFSFPRKFDAETLSKKTDRAFLPIQKEEGQLNKVHGTHVGVTQNGTLTTKKGSPN